MSEYSAFEKTLSSRLAVAAWQTYALTLDRALVLAFEGKIDEARAVQNQATRALASNLCRGETPG